LRSIAELKAEDPVFDQTKLEEKIANLYVQMQNAWTAKDFEPMRPYFTNQLYAQFDRLLDVYRQQHKTNYVDNIAVLDVTIRGWYEQDDDDCIVARVRTRIIDYTLDDKTDELLEGSKTREVFMEHEYVLVRTKGSLTRDQEDGAESLHCPNCGAPLDIAASAKCSYCGSVITAKDYDWVISIIKGISQQFGS
jgi:predicted lipid-binding transport protein (Tim44 family)